MSSRFRSHDASGIIGGWLEGLEGFRMLLECRQGRGGTVLFVDRFSWEYYKNFTKILQKFTKISISEKCEFFSKIGFPQNVSRIVIVIS